MHPSNLSGAHDSLTQRCINGRTRGSKHKNVSGIWKIISSVTRRTFQDHRNWHSHKMLRCGNRRSRWVKIEVWFNFCADDYKYDEDLVLSLIDNTNWRSHHESSDDTRHLSYQCRLCRIIIWSEIDTVISLHREKCVQKWLITRLEKRSIMIKIRARMKIKTEKSVSNSKHVVSLG